MARLSEEQQIQEDEYLFPKNYLSVYLERYRRLEYLRYLSRLTTIKAMLTPLEGLRVLDAGCGDGRFCYELNGEGARLVGVDYSEQAIRWARAFNPAVEFHVADLVTLDFHEEFDVVTCLDVLEHFPPEQVPAVVANLCRALKPGGRLLVSVPSTNKAVNRKHYQHFTVETLEKLFVPRLVPVAKKGHSRRGRPWALFNRLANLARLIWPLRGRVPGANAFISYVERYFHTRVAPSPMEQAKTIIELFEKAHVESELPPTAIGRTNSP